MFCGKKFDRLLVTRLAASSKFKRSLRYLCICDCGNETIVDGRRLRSKHTRSCGCLAREKRISKTRSKHEMYYSDEYKTWTSIKIRCGWKKSKYYGARGISVCDRWIKSFDAFYEDMGDKPSAKHTIDRIDVNGNYEPSNCKWATMKEQSVNRRNTKYITINGVKKCLMYWLTIYNVGEYLVRSRMRQGWDMNEELFTTPKKTYKQLN